MDILIFSFAFELANLAQRFLGMPILTIACIYSSHPYSLLSMAFNLRPFGLKPSRFGLFLS
jgi:hypothetical protein